MFTVYQLLEAGEEFATYAPTEPQGEKKFAIDFTRIGLPQIEPEESCRFVGDYD